MPTPEVTLPPEPLLDGTYLAAVAQQYDEPDYVANLTSIVNIYTREQQEQAGKALAAPDHGLDGIKYRARRDLEPALSAFDAQFSTAYAARHSPTPTLTEFGFQQEAALIGKNRQAAIQAVVAPLREELRTLETKTAEQIARARPGVTDEHREAATTLAYNVAILAPGPALAEVARWVGEAVAAKDLSRAVAILPYLRGLEGEPKYRNALAEVHGLIAHVEAVSRTWQSVTSAARMQRIQRLQYELDRLTELAQHPNGEAQRYLANQPGWTFKQPPPVDAPRDPSGKFTPTGKGTLRRAHLTPEQRAQAEAARLARQKRED
ncbi:MAG TPA: hypothetical protein VJN62_02285 [Gemmatimonadales bacterium]|nr:hypothetical protein [Gemmatimonadales bacterium]